MCVMRDKEKWRILLQIREARTRIAIEKMISESKVSVEEIRDRIGQDVKIANIVELLNVEKGIISLDEMYEKGEQIEFIEGIDASVFGDEIDTETKEKMERCCQKNVV